MQSWTILKLIEWTTDYFKKHGVPNPRLDAELLLSHTLGKKRIELYLSFESIVSEKDLATFKEYLQRRAKREPLQYITGEQGFCSVKIKVTPDVLIPRPETELLVEEVLKKVQRSTLNVQTTEANIECSTPDIPLNIEHSTLNILDLCTGSGCIIAALANELPEALFTGTDISEKALEIAKQNIEPYKDRVELLHGDLFGTVQGKFDVITSNPPYIPEEELKTLQSEVRDFEPKEALVSGTDGLDTIRRIVTEAPTHLNPNGWLIMEIGDKQADKVKELINNADCYSEPDVIKDYGGIERIIATQLK